MGTRDYKVWSPKDLAQFEIELTEVYQTNKEGQDSVTISRRRYGNLVINYDSRGVVSTVYREGEKLY